MGQACDADAIQAHQQKDSEGRQQQMQNSGAKPEGRGDGSLEYLRFNPLSRHPTFKQDEYLASYHAAGTPHAPRKEPAGPHHAPSPSLPALLWQQDSRLGAARGLRVCREV